MAPDKVILIVGATGGVGQSAIQFAANLQAHVIATAKHDAADMVKSLGAHETVDYTSAPLAEQVAALHPEGIDAIIDVVSDPTALHGLSQLVKPGGAVVSAVDTAVVPPADPTALADRDIRGVNVRVLYNTAMLKQLSELVETGQLRILVESELPLEEAPGALERNRAGGARGKTVFII